MNLQEIRESLEALVFIGYCGIQYIANKVEGLVKGLKRNIRETYKIIIHPGEAYLLYKFIKRFQKLEKIDPYETIDWVIQKELDLEDPL